jgi:V8-like Glu-specific endopeptidase
MAGPRARARIRLVAVAAPLVVAALVVAALVVAALVTGCAPGPPGRPHGPVGAPAFWDRPRLLAAQALGGGRVQRGQSGTADPAAALRVGALFEHNASGNHFCTASVVASPGKDLLITAAHCINGGQGSSGYSSDIVFIPGYRDGQEPHGVWTVARLLVAPQWAKFSDPDYDVGFVVLQPHDGRNIQDVLGANKLAIDSGYRYLVHVTGYPDSADAPITGVNTTSRQSAAQLRFDCPGYTGGTSGSPWVRQFSPRSRTRTGTIVGVIGGYQEGGDTPSVSYSVRLGAAVHELYEQAVSGKTATGQALRAESGAGHLTRASPGFNCELLISERRPTR